MTQSADVDRRGCYRARSMAAVNGPSNCRPRSRPRRDNVSMKAARMPRLQVRAWNSRSPPRRTSQPVAARVIISRKARTAYRNLFQLRCNFDDPRSASS
ncbi:hypothetical protein MRX96_011467 [Rhipicephalus microplus]